jgi:hypothetical protein
MASGIQADVRPITGAPGAEWISRVSGQGSAPPSLLAWAVRRGNQGREQHQRTNRWDWKLGQTNVLVASPSFSRRLLKGSVSWLPCCVGYLRGSILPWLGDQQSWSGRRRQQWSSGGNGRVVLLRRLLQIQNREKKMLHFHFLLHETNS